MAEDEYSLEEDAEDEPDACREVRLLSATYEWKQVSDNAGTHLGHKCDNSLAQFSWWWMYCLCSAITSHLLSLVDFIWEVHGFLLHQTFQLFCYGQ